MVRGRLISLAAFVGLATTQVQSNTDKDKYEHCPVFYTSLPEDCRPFSQGFIGFPSLVLSSSYADVQILEHAFAALSVMQEAYFDPDFGTWPSAIDWTGAVIETIVSGMLSTLSSSLGSTNITSIENWKAKENLISSYFAQVVSSFFGQDVLSLRGEAFDDILWVVLGWIETIKFVNVHTKLHYPTDGLDSGKSSHDLKEALHSTPWHGQNWVLSFSHRTRIFWHLGSGGWDTKYCHGGMVWDRRLKPYKNAVTNELWISASISMYQHFPGDNFTAPWLSEIPFPEKDPAHLDAATQGYRWLSGINMTNQQGLFADGFHIDGSKPGNTECDIRDEMIYTYNQGVILTGQRGLWAVSGIPSYLQDGHRLIQSVINATGWNLKENLPDDEGSHLPNQLPRWRGIGRGGILEEQCDASGTCSQDGQTFKGIFFHHLAAFCTPLEPAPSEPDLVIDTPRYQRVKDAHAVACRSYLGWIKHNSLAALATRNSDGKFGMWWGASIFGSINVSQEEDGINHTAENTTDYRNSGTPRDNTWGLEDSWMPGGGNRGWVGVGQDLHSGTNQHVLGSTRKDEYRPTPGQAATGGSHYLDDRGGNQDPNDRGRGRTVETQAGGLALLRAYWEISQAHRRR